MRRDWVSIALFGAAAAALIGGFALTNAAYGNTPVRGAGMMGWSRSGQSAPREGWGHGMMGDGPGWMQEMHNGMMGGGGPETVPDAPPRMDAPVAQRTISIREWSMKPAAFQVKAGSRLVLTIKNEGAMPHNLAIPELGVRLVNIPSGGTRTLELNLDQPGEFTFLCDIPGHAQAGQQGILTVTD